MANLSPEQIGDLVQATISNYRRKSWVDLSQDDQFFLFAERMLKGKKETPTMGGDYQKWDIQTGITSTAKHTELYHEDQTEVTNLLTQARQPWSLSTVNYSYDVQESAFQGGDTTMIIDFIKVREHAMYCNWFDLMETDLWSAPANDSVSPRPMSGIPFWIQKGTQEGFYGLDPAGFTSGGAGNILVANVPRWKNYTFNYAAVTTDDFITKLRRATAMCEFRSPHSYSQLGGVKANWEFFTTYRMQEQAETFLDSRADNQKDLSGSAGQAMFKGIKIQWVPKLENSENVATYDPSDPFYGVNWSTIEWFVQKGYNMIRHPPVQHPRQHNVRNVFMDNTANTLCYNRRLNFVGSML